MASLLRGSNKSAGRSASADGLNNVLSSRPTQPAGSKQQPQQPGNSTSSNNMIKFKVTQLALDNSTQTHVLSLDTRTPAITLSAPLSSGSSPPPTPPPRHPDDSPTQPATTLPAANAASSTWLVSDVADIEKCHCTSLNNRAILVFFDDTPYPPVDVGFLDRATRDIFCELVASTDRGISIKNGCGGFVVSHWVEDAQVRRCSKCSRDFGVSLRRHHCRLCGRVFCWACSDNRASLPDLGYSTPVRVCEKCFNTVRDHRVQGMVGAVTGGGGKGGGLLGGGSGGSEAGVAAGAPVHNFNGQHAQHNVEKRQQLLRKSSTDSTATGSSAALHDRSTEKREEEDDGERVEPPSASDKPTSLHASATSTTASSSSSSSSSAPVPLPTVPHLHYSHSSASPRGITPRDGAFRSGKRDKYGFIVGGEGTRGQDDRPYHLVHQHKQRKRWNQYLAMHPQLDKTAELRKLVRKGIPHELRGPVWQVLSGSNDRQADHPSGYYRQLVKESEEKSGCGAEIEKDLRRTFPDNHLYESEEGLAMLRRVLMAYSVYNPAIGYCQSMNFITALCLLFMDEEPAFWLLTYIVEELTCIDLLPTAAAAATAPSASAPSTSSAASASTSASAPSSASSTSSPASSSRMYYYQADLAGVHVDQAVFASLLADKLPRIAAHFDKLELSIGPFTVNWFLCLFVNTLPLETALHVWDCMFSEGPKTLFRCALALMKVNEKSILQARDFEAVLLKAKHFHLAAVESVEFAHVMFDDVWLGAFPMSRIDALRRKHRAKIVEELEERRRQLELNEDDAPFVKPSEMAHRKQREEEEGREVERKENGSEADAAESGKLEGANDSDELEEKRTGHTTAVLSSSLRAQLHLSEAALADPFSQLSPNVQSPSHADESDPQYEHRFSSLQQYIGPEHATDMVEGYIVLKGEERKKEAGSAEAAEAQRPAVEMDEEAEEEGEEEEEDEDYEVVEKPRSHSTATPPQLPSPSASSSTLPWRKPTLPSRIKSASLSSLPYSASASGPHSRKGAAGEQQRRANSGQSSPSGEGASLFAGFKSIFNRNGGGGKAPAAPRTLTQESGSRQPQWSGSEEEDEELPSPGPAQQYVRPPPAAAAASTTRKPSTELDDESSASSASSQPPRGGPIFRRNTDSPTGTQRVIGRGQQGAGPIHPRIKPIL